MRTMCQPPDTSCGLSWPAQIVHVTVGAESGVIGEIPAIVVRVLIDHDRIAVPEPVPAEAIVVGSDAEIEVVEPEAFPIPALEMKHMAPTEAAAEMSVLPRMIAMKVGIATTRIVPDPPVVVMNMGGVWMSWLVGMALGGIWMSWLAVIALGLCSARSLRGTRTASRNVSSADGVSGPACLAAATTVTAATATTLFAANAPRLAHNWNRTQHQYRKKLDEPIQHFHIEPQGGTAADDVPCWPRCAAPRRVCIHKQCGRAAHIAAAPQRSVPGRPPFCQGREK